MLVIGYLCYYRPCSKGSEPLSSQDLKKPFNFVQMTLEEEEEEEAEERAGGLQEITFSPVLIWKPGRKLMKKYHRRVGTPPQECGCGVGGGGVGGGRDGGGGVGVGGRRSPIPLKTMDLTDALPPERTDKTVERKVCGWVGGWFWKGRGATNNGHLYCQIPLCVNANTFQNLTNWQR